jgi:hypothetical protein
VFAIQVGEQNMKRPGCFQEEKIYMQAAAVLEWQQQQ